MFGSITPQILKMPSFDQPLKNEKKEDENEVQKQEKTPQVISQKQMQAYSNSFDFNYTTSNGDKLSLSLNSSTMNSFSSDKSGSSHMLMRSFSYEMKYEGGAITEQVQDEIAKALEEAKPMMEQFFAKANENENSAVESFRNNLSTSLKQRIAPLQNEQNSEQIKDQTAKGINDVMQLFDINENLFKQASKLFEEIFDTSKILNFSA